MVTGKTQAKSNFGAVQIGIVLLTAATALIHLYLNVLMGKIDVLFTLNGLGYLGLLGAMFLPIPIFVRYRAWIRIALMLFTVVTLAAWIFLGARDALGYTDKLIEVALLVLLWMDRGRI